MVILNIGKNRIRDLIYDDIDTGQLGSGTAVAIETNTALTTPVAGTVQTIEKTTSDKLIKITYTNPATGTVGTFAEYMTNSTANSINYDRTVFSAYTQTSSYDVIVIKRYFIRSS